MPLNDARRKQLDEIVTKMDGGGASPDEIQAVVGDFKSKFENETPQSDVKASEDTQTGGSVPPGVLGLIGAATAAGAPLARKAVGVVAGQVAKHPRAIGSITAGMMGGDLAAHLGLPMSAGYFGGHMAALEAAPYIKRVAQGVQNAVGTTMPRVAGRFASLPIGRRLVNTVAGRILPGIGQALMVADAGRGGYWAGQKIDEATGASEKMGNALGPLYHALFQKDAQAIDPNDPTIQELVARQTAAQNK